MKNSNILNGVQQLRPLQVIWGHLSVIDRSPRPFSTVPLRHRLLRHVIHSTVLSSKTAAIAAVQATSTGWWHRIPLQAGVYRDWFALIIGCIWWYLDRITLHICNCFWIPVCCIVVAWLRHLWLFRYDHSVWKCRAQHFRLLSPNGSFWRARFLWIYYVILNLYIDRFIVDFMPCIAFGDAAMVLKSALVLEKVR